MKLNHWAALQGIPYKTAWLWFKSGKLPVKAYQTETGMIIVSSEQTSATATNGTAVVYARVSSPDQKNDLEAQSGRVSVWAIANGYTVTRVVIEIGSGLNPHRKQLLSLLADSSVSHLIVEHRDRLMRFGSEYIEASLTHKTGNLSSSIKEN